MSDNPVQHIAKARKLIFIFIFPIIIIYSVVASFIAKMNPDYQYWIFSSFALLFILPVYFTGKLIKKNSDELK